MRRARPLLVVLLLAVAVAVAPPPAQAQDREPAGIRITAERADERYVATIRTCDRAEHGNAEIRVRDRRTGRTVRRTTTNGRPLCRADDRTRASHLTLGRGGAVLYATTRCMAGDPRRCEPDVLWKWTGRAPRAIDEGPGELSAIRRYRDRFLEYTRGTDATIFRIPRARRGGTTCRAGRTLQRGDGARIFQVRTTVYGCLHPRRGVIPLGRSFGGAPSGESGVHDIALAAPYVAFAQEERHYGLGGDELRVVDLRTGRTTKRESANGSWAGSEGGGPITQIDVDGRGAVVWVAGMRVPPCRDGSCTRPVLWAWVNDFPTLLDVDPGELTDVRLTPGGAAWVRAGEARAEGLTRTCDAYEYGCND